MELVLGHEFVKDELLKIYSKHIHGFVSPPRKNVSRCDLYPVYLVTALHLVEL